MASKAQTVLAALKAALETNYGTTVYSPDTVFIITKAQLSENAFDPSLTTLYLIVLGDDFSGPGPESCTVTEELPLVIIPAHRVESPSEIPAREDPPRYQVSLDLVKDVAEKLRNDEKLGGQVVTTFVGAPGRQLRADHDVYTPNWVAPFVDVTLRYRYEKTER